MAKSSWRDRFEFALQTAMERSSGVRELASRGLEEGARQFGAWQERQRQSELLLALGRLTWEAAQAGRLHQLAENPAVAEMLARLAEDGEARQSDRTNFSGFDDDHARYGSSAYRTTGARPSPDDDDGTVSSLAGHRDGTGRSTPGTAWKTTDDLDAADLATFMHPDDLESR